MKKQFLIITALIVVISIFSCKKEDAAEIAPLLTSASMSATIEGSTWTSLTRVTKHYPSTKLFVLSSSDVDQKAMVITIRGDEKGIYNLSLDSLNARVGIIWKPDTNEYISKTGTVEIKEINTSEKRISGTFNFEVVNKDNYSDEQTISNGVFTNVKYSESDTTSTN